MSDLPIHFLPLVCGSFLLLGISVASATAQYLRSQRPQAARVTIKCPVNR